MMITTTIEAMTNINTNNPTTQHDDNLSWENEHVDLNEMESLFRTKRNFIY